MNYIKLLLLFVLCWCLQFTSARAETINNNSSLHNLLQSGIAQIEQGDLEQAQHTLTEIIDRHPELSHVSTNYNLYDKRSNEIVNSIQLAYLHRGLAAYRLGKYQLALADFDVAQKIYPWQVEPYYNMGLAWSGQREYEEAIAQYNLALTQVSSQDETKIADIYNDRGLAYLNLHNFAAAISDFNLGLRYQGNNSWLYYNRGCACHRYGDYAQAINSFSQALAVNPNQSEAYINRGLIHYHLGHIEIAFADLNAGAKSFYSQGKMVDFEKVMELIKQMHSKISDLPSLAV
ncbi:tetratricopeptide repeat protein [Merismopedia glauca]|uniref:Tetratricopeptide repeat protein n=1 Tax=Merismopedia glauca CCAP 1448/3 TaxID=1296344 RepID=A0A2T1C718_9CYAN|nr:tetratricopeptide repeat protein [Merismopedia glauca]PSB04051.1 hypothetical protein C7B64_05835 [Merismopedia glauca CCAP 1448/3]